MSARARTGHAAAWCMLLIAGTWHAAAAQTAVSGSGNVAWIEHRVVGPQGLEATSGTIFGAGGTLALGTAELSVSAGAGNLSAVSSTAETQAYATLALRATLLPMPWLALTAGASLAAYDTPLARQRWTTTRIGAEVRLPFSTGALSALARVEMFPTVTVTGLTQPTGFAAATGLRWRGGPFTASLSYALERYDFEPSAGVRRREQLATLTASLGLRLRARQAAPRQ